MPQPPQKQTRQPGREYKMHPLPEYLPKSQGAGRLEGKVALITGGDSGIGRATAIAMAREGADIAIVYLEEHKDADETIELIENEGRDAIKIAGDVGDEAFCKRCVGQTVKEFGRLDVLVNNAAEQHEVESLTELTEKQLTKTFRTNIFSFFFMAKHALKHMKKGASIINTASITAYRGHKTLLDYSATKGAIVTSPVRCRNRWSRRAFASTRWRRDQSGRRSFLHRSSQRKWRSTAPARQWSARASRTRWRPATYSWRATMRPT